MKGFSIATECPRFFIVLLESILLSCRAAAGLEEITSKKILQSRKSDWRKLCERLAPLGIMGDQLRTLTHFFPPLRFRNQVPTFAVRETDVSRHNGGTSDAPLKPLRVDSVLRALSSLRGLRGAPEVPPLCRETSVSRTANVGT